MTRFRSMIFTLTTCGLLLWISPAEAQQIALAEFPVSALVRGENVWLRLDPAADTEIITLLQRGDPITITGESMFDGAEEFYPVDADLTGDSGWIEVLFIDPRSISGSSAVVVPLNDLDVPAGETEAVDEAGNQRQQNREDRRQGRQAETDVAPEPDPQAADAADAADDRAARRAARQAEQDPAAEAEQPANDRAARQAERQAQGEGSGDGANASADALVFSGEEPTVTPEFTPPAEVLTIFGSFEGERGFAVTAVAPDGAEQTVFDERGPFSGETTLEADPGSTLILDVQANGPWEITVEPAA